MQRIRQEQARIGRSPRNQFQNLGASLAQRAKRNLLHVFEAEPDLPVADPVLLAAKCAPAQARKKKADSRFASAGSPNGIAKLGTNGIGQAKCSPKPVTSQSDR